MAKVSRNTIYEAIKGGKLSRCPSGKVDTSEVLRVFGDPNERHTRKEEKAYIEQVKVRHQQDSKTEQLYQAQIRTLEEALRQAREQIDEAKGRELWQRGQIEKLTDTIKLIEAPKTTKPKAFFDRLFGS